MIGAAALLTLAFAGTGTGAAPRDETPGTAQARVSLDCNIGPVERVFGGANWTVYACSDGATLVVASSADNPARPFYFVLTQEAGHYAIRGEGNGDKTTSDAAGDDLRKLGDTGIRALLRAAQGKAPDPK